MNISYCPNCEQTYSQENPPKVLINCQHSLCYQCLLKQILCPIDHKRIERRKYSVEAFKTNTQLLQQIVFSKEKGVKEVDDSIEDKANCGIVKSQKVEQTPYQLKVEQNILKQKSCNIIQKSSEKKKQLQNEAQSAQFQQCLLHNKKADLICLNDKCLICVNCGLFGQHKLHELLPYDRFALQFGQLAEQCFKIQKMIKQAEEKTSVQAITRSVQQKVKSIEGRQKLRIKEFIEKMIQNIQQLELQLQHELQTVLKMKEENIKNRLNTIALEKHSRQFTKISTNINQGLNDIMNVKNIQQYIGYLYQDNVKDKGNLLIQSFNSKLQESQQFITKQFQDLQVHLQFPPPAFYSSLWRIGNKNTQNVKQSPSAKKMDQLLIHHSSKRKQKEGLSPIAPVAHFDDAPDSHFEQLVKLNQIQIPISRPPRHPNSKLTSTRKEYSQHESISKTCSKAKSINSSNHTERQFINMLSQNNNRDNNIKKKKRLDLPQKYNKVYEQLVKDHLDVLDLGGAFLGESTILKIVELIPTRTKLKSVKLMNNKLGDDIFRHIVHQCTNISSLNLSYNNFSQKVLQYLQSSCRQLGQLENITLSNNKIVLRNVRDRLQMLRRQGLKVSL